ncbi:MAG: exosortase/archaeosortase family protein [Candidatus Sulfotelmatobacter sp.]
MPSAPDRESIFESLSLPVFSILGAISLAIWWSPLASSFALALHDDQYTHILLILPISAALIFMDWKRPEPFHGSSAILGSALLIAAASVTFFMRWKALALSPDERLAVNMLALVVWWIAAFILCFGDRAFRRSLFPLCFLFWLVPFPDFVLNPVVNLLQQGSAAAAHLLFAAVGVPVEQRGVLLHIPGLMVEVARECSSIRSSSMLIVTTMVLAQLLLRSPWRKALVILVAIPLSVAKNGLRIFVIAMLATRVDPSFLTGRLHRQGGIIFFLIALAVIFLLLWILRRGEEANHGIRTTRAV